MAGDEIVPIEVERTIIYGGGSEEKVRVAVRSKSSRREMRYDWNVRYPYMTPDYAHWQETRLVLSRSKGKGKSTSFFFTC